MELPRTGRALALGDSRVLIADRHHCALATGAVLPRVSLSLTVTQTTPSGVTSCSLVQLAY